MGVEHAGNDMREEKKLERNRIRRMNEKNDPCDSLISPTSRLFWPPRPESWERDLHLFIAPRKKLAN